MMSRFATPFRLIPLLLLGACSLGELEPPPAHTTAGGGKADDRRSAEVPDDVAVDGGFFAADLAADCGAIEHTFSGGDVALGSGHVITLPSADASSASRTCTFVARYAVPPGRYPSYLSASVLATAIGTGARAAARIDARAAGLVVTGATDVPADGALVVGYGELLGAPDALCGERALTTIDVHAVVSLDAALGDAAEMIAGVDGADVHLDLAECP